MSSMLAGESLEESAYIIGLSLVLVGAFTLSYLDGLKPSISATLSPLLHPSEKLPWEHMRNFEFSFDGPFGLGVSPAEPRTAQGATESARFDSLEQLLTVRMRISSYWSLFVAFLRAAVREVIISVSPSSYRGEHWNAVWWRELFVNHCYARISDCWNRPVSSAPTSRITVVERLPPDQSSAWLVAKYTPFRVTERSIPCINLASYNYLAFGGLDVTITPACVKAVRSHGVATGRSAAVAAATAGSVPACPASPAEQLSREIAEFLGKEAAVVMGMGFATNSTLLPAIIDCTGGRQPGGKQPGGRQQVLVVSDELNHRSIVEGVRLSGAKVQAFKHNDMGELENLLSGATGGGYREVWVVVEGLYSMEGDFCKIREIVRLKNKFGARLYLDEAHSIGAVGKTGRGVCELFQVPTSEVDVMMGTFTKSFGSAGGYVASDKAMIAQIKRHSIGFNMANEMVPVCATQALEALRLLRTKRGMKKVEQVTKNSNYFREGLQKLGLHLLGEIDSPIICAMLISPVAVAAFSRECLKRNLAVVVVGYPATPMLLSRARFCVSAAHTQTELDHALKVIDQVADLVGVKYAIDADPYEQTAQLLQRRTLSLAQPLRDGTSTKTTAGWALPDEEAATTKQQQQQQQRQAIDAVTCDPLGLLASPVQTVVEATVARLEAFGCGTCGPRGFYGTTTDHLELERSLATFMNTEAAIVYSSHVATASSVVAAFVNKEDSVLLQSEANFGLLTGVRLTRSRDVKLWRDAEELRTLVAKIDGNAKRRQNANWRLWIICEGGLHKNFDLAAVAQVKTEFGGYLCLDDSLCIGVTGRTGRGSVEQFGVAVSDVELLIGSLEHTLGSMGGFCCGRQDVISHQVLSGAAYCFSASAPACLQVAATKTLEFLATSEGAARLERVQDAVQEFVEKFKNSNSNNKVELISDPQSFVQLLVFKDKLALDVCKKLKHTLALPLAIPSLQYALLDFLPNGACPDPERVARTLRVNLSAKLSKEEVAKIAEDILHVLTLP